MCSIKFHLSDVAGLSSQQAALAAQGAALAQQVAHTTITITIPSPTITTLSPHYHQHYHYHHTFTNTITNHTCLSSFTILLVQGVMMQAAYPAQQFQVSGQPTTIAL